MVKHNFKKLLRLVDGNDNLFTPLRSKYDIAHNVPQTLPIVIKRGNRESVYKILNESGFGVVSLYHTMINELKDGKHEDACWLSKRIMNLPIHQDVDTSEYREMMKLLVKACQSTISAEFG